MLNQNVSYWDGFYGGHQAPGTPSDFAVFVAQQLDPLGFVIDVGCGNGRDSSFFLSLGVPVFSVDQSEVAIEELQTRHIGTKLISLATDIESPDLCRKMEQWLETLADRKGGVLYARFFLHAINEQQEEAFLRIVSKLSTAYQLTVCVEFRTQLDAKRAKVTPKHYRRYIDPHLLIHKANALGLNVVYFTQGLGFARFGADDAHVARIFLTSEVR